MKRLVCFCLCSILFLSLLTGCEGQSTTGTNQPTATPTTIAPTTVSTPTTSASTTASTPALNGDATQALTQVATQFYNAIKAHDYALAYTYLDAHATNADGQQLTLSSIEQMAQMMESQDGPITAFTVAAYPPNVVMTITRTQLGAYHTHLQMKQEGQNWKIISIDRV